MPRILLPATPRPRFGSAIICHEPQSGELMAKLRAVHGKSGIAKSNVGRPQQSRIKNNGHGINFPDHLRVASISSEACSWCVMLEAGNPDTSEVYSMNRYCRTK